MIYGPGQAGWKGSTVPRCRLGVSGQWAPVCWKHPLWAPRPQPGCSLVTESLIRVILSLSLVSFPDRHHTPSACPSYHDVLLSYLWSSESPGNLSSADCAMCALWQLTSCVPCDNWHGTMGNNNQDTDQLSWESPGSSLAIFDPSHPDGLRSARVDQCWMFD